LSLELLVPIKHGRLQSVHTIALMVSSDNSYKEGTILTICSSERIECYRLDSLRCKPTDIWLWLEWQSVSKHALDIYYGRRECSGSTSSTNPSACVQLLDSHQCRQPSIWCRIDDRSRFGRRTSPGFLFAHGSFSSEEGKTEIRSSAHFRTALGTNGSSWKLPQAVVLYPFKVWYYDDYRVGFNICTSAT
jgi:hypothetical protein